MATTLARPIGRFAPSPTGDLHFGSLIAALGSYLSIHSKGGAWRVRVEDIDPSREVPGSAERIIADLRRFGMEPDGEVLYQSKRLAAFLEATEFLLACGQAFHCACTRADLFADGVYPGTCRQGIASGRLARSVRVLTGTETITFTDQVHGPCSTRLDQECGDFVIRRADGWPAYQLAVVVDDACQGVTEVVRGSDLLASTPRQIHLQRLLGLPQPAYLHLPLVLDAQGRKLSKRQGSDPVNPQDPANSLRTAMLYLGFDPPVFSKPEQLLAWGVASWRADAVPKGPAVPGAGADDP